MVLADLAMIGAMGYLVYAFHKLFQPAYTRVSRETDIEKVKTDIMWNILDKRGLLTEEIKEVEESTINQEIEDILNGKTKGKK